MLNSWKFNEWMLNKWLLKSGLLLVLVMLLTLRVSAQQDKPPITVYLDGERVQFEAEPFVERGSVLVPFRPIFTKLGLSMEWDATARKVIGKKSGLTIELQIGSETAWVNGQSYQLSVAPVLRNNQTFIPLRFISEHAAREVNWNEAKQVIYIAKTEALILYVLKEAMSLSDSESRVVYFIEEMKREQALVKVNVFNSNEESIWQYRLARTATGGQWKVVASQLRYRKAVGGQQEAAVNLGEVNVSDVDRIVIQAVLAASRAEMGLDQEDFRFTIGNAMFLSGDSMEAKLQYSILAQRISGPTIPDSVSEYVVRVKKESSGQWEITESRELSRDYRVDAVIAFLQNK
jgi:hypothetical protein